MHILIVFASKEGQTAKIAERMALVIRNQGHQVTSHSGKDLDHSFATEAFDAAIIGGPIHMGKYPPHLNEFVSSHRDWLNSVPSAFFTVCMAINSKNPQSREQAKAYGTRFMQDTRWHPTLITSFAGAVKYTQYDFITRFIMKMISKKEGGSTDTSCDHEYTNWEDVVRFTEQFLSETQKVEAA